MSRKTPPEKRFIATAKTSGAACMEQRPRAWPLSFIDSYARRNGETICSPESFEMSMLVCNESLLANTFTRTEKHETALVCHRD